MKKKEISANDIGNIKENLLNSIKNICNDLQYLSEKKAQLPQNPTMESAEESINIENDRKQTRENAYQMVLMMYQANKALDKSFEPVETTDANYGEEFKNYLRQKEEFKKISDNLSSLYDITEGINSNTLNVLNRIREFLKIEPKIKQTLYNNFSTRLSQNLEPVVDLISDKAQNIITKLMNYINKNFLLSEKNNNKITVKDLAIEIYLAKTRFIQKDKIDELLNDYVIRKNVPTNMTNDFRHRAGSTLMSKYIGDVDRARLWGNFKEIRDLVIGKENDTEIDSKNNAIGRQIYLQNPNASEQELIDIVYEGIKNGVTYNVKDEDKKIPWQDFLYFLNNYTYKIKNK